MTKSISNFFHFKKTFLVKGIYLSFYYGWNSLLIIKINFRKNSNLNFIEIFRSFPKLIRKEKFFLVTHGAIKLTSPLFNKTLKQYDVMNSFSNFRELTIKSEQKSEFFLISARTKNKSSNKVKFFNIKKDIEPRNLWGGKCISRPFEGNEINIVMFNLKKGFKFNDKGHLNEQITWLNKGEMSFYSQKKRGTLKTNNGIDIGSFHKHGGVSKGAVGFDVFFPKREERKYKN